MIKEDDCFMANSSLYIATTLGDEMMFMNMKTGDYINLNAVAAFIWKKIEHKQICFTELVACLIQEYEVDLATCTSETISVLEDMLEKCLITKVTG